MTICRPPRGAVAPPGGMLDVQTLVLLARESASVQDIQSRDKFIADPHDDAAGVVRGCGWRRRG